MSQEKIVKVWGTRDRVFSSDMCEIDYLELYPNSQCSVHFHDEKINKFIVIVGEVLIRTCFGDVLLKKGERIVIEPPLVHQFKTLDGPAKLIEIAYVNDGFILEDDIVRRVQGGRVIEGRFNTLKEMQDRNILDMLEGMEGPTL